MVLLHPYPARHATAPPCPARSITPVQQAQTTPRVQPWRLQPPHMACLTFGGPATSACPPPEGVLVDLSPPPGHSANSQTRDLGARPEAGDVQNVARRLAYSESDDHLAMQIPEGFDKSYPLLVDLHPVEAYHRSKKVRTRLKESLMPASRPGLARVIPSVGDLNLLAPSSGLRGFASRQQELREVTEQEIRRITLLQDQISQASINVDRLRRDLQFVDRQMSAAQHHSWDCTLPQPCDVDQEAFSYLPYAGEDNEESSPIALNSTTKGIWTPVFPNGA